MSVNIMFAEDSILFYGHKEIRATHKTTLEITKDNHLTSKGECIIGVRANKALPELNERLKMIIRNSSAIIHIDIIVDGKAEHLKAFGHPDLTLSHPTDIVIRRGRYTCSRTLGILCNKAADDLSRDLIESLRNEKAQGLLIIRAENILGHI